MALCPLELVQRRISQVDVTVLNELHREHDVSEVAWVGANLKFAHGALGNGEALVRGEQVFHHLHHGRCPTGKFSQSAIRSKTGS